MAVTKRPLFDPPIVRRAAKDAFLKLAPAHMVRNPVMFVVLVGSVFTTFALVRDAAGAARSSASSSSSRSGSGSRSCSPTSPRRWRKGAARRRPTSCARRGGLRVAKRLEGPAGPVARRDACPRATSAWVTWCLCRPGDVIPGDGEVIDGVASVDESAITGESAPVIRESGGDRSAVTGGTKVLSDQLIVRITAEPGQTFLDRMIALVEGASRQKTPNEIALTILLSGLTIIFLLAIATLQPLAVYSGGGGRRCRSSSRCSSASSRRPSAGCSPPSASRAWTASSSTTSSR